MGAFDYGPYRYPMSGAGDPRLAAAIRAIKTELIYMGLDQNIDPAMNVYGNAVENRVKDLQQASGLRVDGQVGPATALELFRRRVQTVEKAKALPPGTLGRKIKLESGYDPVAIGSRDPDDTGIAQINRRAHPTVTVEQAFTPSFAIDWAGNYLLELKRSVEERANTLKAARGAYNTGAHYATLWMTAGFPASGGPEFAGEDVFVRLTRYIALVDRQTW